MSNQIRVAKLIGETRVNLKYNKENNWEQKEILGFFECNLHDLTEDPKSNDDLLVASFLVGHEGDVSFIRFLQDMLQNEGGFFTDKYQKESIAKFFLGILFLYPAENPYTIIEWGKLLGFENWKLDDMYAWAWKQFEIDTKLI